MRRVEQRVTGEFLKVEGPDGVVVSIPEWMVDIHVCAGMKIGSPQIDRMRRLRPIDFARFRWVTCLREGHRLQMEALHGGWWGWVCRAV